MRAAIPLSFLLLPAALLATACSDVSNPAEPWEATGPLEDLAYWADGYLRSNNRTAPVSTAEAAYSFNRGGGAMTITKVAGTTGRYIARFKGLSALLGAKTTLHATSWELDKTYCQPVGAFLARDSVEVRCYKAGTGTPTNGLFYLSVLGRRDDRAFVFANQPTAASYSPANSGSWNPTGATRVVRMGLGKYQVTFAGIATRFPAGFGGHLQVSAVGTGKAYCKLEEWGGLTDLSVYLGCYSPAGAAADTKFTVQVTPPAAHLAFAYANLPTADEYRPDQTYSSNPVGGAINISRYGTGIYVVRWTGVDAEIRNMGNVQVTAYGWDGTLCKASGSDNEAAYVLCFGPNGVAKDAAYTVLLGS
jgi:hypothetical protein